MSHFRYLLLLTLLLSGGLFAQEIKQLNRIVAIVDENVITEAELEQRYDTLMVQMRGNNNLPPESVIKRQLLDRLILERIQVDRARRVGISIGDEDLNRTLRNVARQNGLSLEQFRQVLERDGVDFVQFRENIRDEMMIGRLRTREVENRVSVSPQELERYLESDESKRDENITYHVSHILIQVPEAASPEQVREARREAESVQTKLAQGAAFREMAIAHSDSGDALEGGDMGWREAGQLPKLFADELVSMDVGEISQPLRSSAGFHLIKLNDRRGEKRHMAEQVHSRHILIKTNELVSDQEAEARLQRLRDRIVSGGESFAELARTHSDDTSAAKGGDLGWANPGMYVPAFEKKLSELNVGQLSEPFQSRFGWHIIELLGRRQVDNTEEMRKVKAQQLLRERKIQEKQEEWLRQIRDEAYVEIRLEEQ